TTAPAVAALTVRFRRDIVVLAFAFFWMAQRRPRTIERFGFAQRNLDNRIDEFEKFLIGGFAIEIVSLVANGITPAAFHPMIIVIEHFLERAAIDHGLIPFKAFALLSFERLDRDRTEFDALHGPPRFRPA